MEEKKSFFSSSFGRYLLPGIILQSVLIGGGYATGREITEYGAKFGAYGWLSGLGTLIGFAVVSILTFELVRLYKIYDYKSVLKEISGPLWVVYDIVYAIFMVIIIAVMAAATGSIIEETMGLNYWVGVAAITVVVGLLNFFGDKIIAQFETLGTILLYAGYILFSVLVISARFGNIQKVFATMDTSYTPNATIGTAIWAGIIYMAFNLVVIPSSFFTLKNQTSRKESVISGLIAGLLMTIPWFLTYFSILGFYPDESVLGATVPWLEMMKGIAGPFMIAFFGLIMGWTLIETSTGITHALIDRVNNGLQEANKPVMTRRQRCALTFTVLIGSTVLAKIGLIDLIAKAYNALAYVFIIVFLIPLLTVGVYKICKKSKELQNK